MVPLPKQNKIALIDLVSAMVNEYSFNFLGSNMIELYLFKESKLICVNE